MNLSQGISDLAAFAQEVHRLKADLQRDTLRIIRSRWEGKLTDVYCRCLDLGMSIYIDSIHYIYVYFKLAQKQGTNWWQIFVVRSHAATAL